MAELDALNQGRESFRRQAWGDAYAQLSAAANEMPLELDDLERLSMAAYLTGRDRESVDALARAYQESVRTVIRLGLRAVPSGSASCW